MQLKCTLGEKRKQWSEGNKEKLAMKLSLQSYDWCWQAFSHWLAADRLLGCDSQGIKHSRWSPKAGSKVHVVLGVDTCKLCFLNDLPAPSQITLK